MAKDIKLGRRVQYTDGQGYVKLGFITGTASTVQPGTEIDVPGQDEAHLLVVSPTGKTYTRTSVPMGEGPRSFTLL